MRTKSLAYQTDLLLVAEMGRVDEHENRFVARTPENPTHVWGNFVLMPSAPKPGDLVHWSEIFDREFAGEPGIRHHAFGWDGTDGDEGAAGEWTKLGFKIERAEVFRAVPSELIMPELPVGDVELRPLESDGDWEKAVELQILCRGGGYDPDEYRDFKTRRLRAFRRLVEADRGRWYGAFHGEQLVGDLGLFTFGGQARFQLVETHPDHRRRGISRNLVFFAAHDFMMNGDADSLIAVAEENSAESGLYAALGFRRIERQRGAFKIGTN